VQYAVASILAEAATLAEARPKVMRAICEEAAWDLAALWVADPVTGRLRCIDLWARPGIQLGEFERFCRTAELSEGEGLPGKVLSEGTARWIADGALDGHPERAVLLHRAGVGGGVAFPFRIGPDVAGVAEFFGRSIRRQDRHLMQTVESLGQQIAQFVDRRRAEAALHESEARTTAIMNAAFDPIITIDARGRVVEFNPAAERTFGYTREEALGRSMAQLVVPPEERARLEAGLAQHAATGRSEILGRRVEIMAMKASGSRFPVEVAVNRVDLPGPAMFTACVRDLTDRRRAEERLREARAIYRHLVEQIPAVTYVDAPNDFSSTIFISPQIEALTGYSPSEWELDPELWVKLLHPEDRERVLAESVRTNVTGDPFNSEYRMVGRGGGTVWVRDEARLVVDGDGRPQYWQGVMIDVTERKRAEDQVAYLAYHDRLTGLPNRAMFEELLELDLARARRHQRSIAVLYMDLDNFKLVNDSLGHDAGDELLRQVAGRLGEASRETDLVARLGGDEFLLLLSDLPGGPADPPGEARAVAEAVATRIHESLQEPFRLAETEFYVSSSIGISLFPLDAEGAGALLQNADAAMYRSKNAGPGGSVVYPVDAADPRGKLSLATHLRRAVEEQRWTLHYQPIVDLVKGHTVGVEALVRWLEPGRGLMPPAEFLPLADEMGLMDQIGDWVLAELSRQWARWAEEGIRLEVSFNLAPRQLWHPELFQKVLGTLRAAGCDPSFVVVEITETAAMTDPDRTQQAMGRLRGEGVRFAIDDFGAGYSSLARLKELPVDVLKIDRSFVRDLPGNPGDATMARTIIQLAHSLGMTPLAEGIETDRQRQFLVDHGCVLGQGYYFSYPLPGDDIARAMAATASRVS
jgi:diguanylate cyclase (GGDEF)-like protein/PAS domain S-box-containing protein